DLFEQASHNDDLIHGVEPGVLVRDDVAQLGDVLAGKASGRTSEDDVTLFDSTGLAIQDLAIALAALESAGRFQLPTLELLKPRRVEERVQRIVLPEDRARNEPSAQESENVSVARVTCSDPCPVAAGHGADDRQEILRQTEDPGPAVIDAGHRPQKLD